jgi:uncharacterized membrane protein YbhN (UPF0104 family)
LSILTIILVIIVVFLAREQVFASFAVMSQINVWILLLLIPAQLVMYYTAGQMYFSYIRAKNHQIKINQFELTRISLEINFTNHVLPSGGASGLAYMAWRLRKFGVTAGQATMMQILRYGIAVVTTVNQMLLAIIILGASGILHGFWFWASLLICLAMDAAVAIILVIISKRSRIDWAVNFLAKAINAIINCILFWKKQPIVLIKAEKLETFLNDLHHDFAEIRRTPKLIRGPFLWGMAYAFLEAFMFMIAFWAMGLSPSIWAVILGQGIASIVGTIMVTPGGAGGYEPAMALLLGEAGFAGGFAGVVLTRVILLLCTILFGWGFYQHALLKRKKTDGTKTIS